jgi:hypothetical protein
VTIYWKNYPDQNKYELLAEPAARCLTLEYNSGRWLVQCLGSTYSFVGNYQVDGAKKKALEWFKEQLGHLVKAVDSLC